MTVDNLDEYQLTFKIELLKEKGVHLLSRLYRYQDKIGIAYDDETNPWIMISDDLAILLNAKIYRVKTVEEIERYEGYLDGIERVLERFSQ